jgi:hypothetical protein
LTVSEVHKIVKSKTKNNEVKKEEKESSKLLKAVDEVRPLSKTEEYIDFKTDKPIPITNDKFWKIKIKTFLYKEYEDKVEDKFLYHRLTGFIFYNEIDENYILFGRIYQGEIYKIHEMDEDTLTWAENCGIHLQ